ncbi:hypothetical protein D3C78_1805670 [compost metagenome]
MFVTTEGFDKGFVGGGRQRHTLQLRMIFQTHGRAVGGFAGSAGEHQAGRIEKPIVLQEVRQHR